MRDGSLFRLAAAGVSLALVTLPRPAAAQLARSIELDPAWMLCELLSDEDTDRDSKITVADPAGTGQRGNRRFQLRATDGTTYEVAGTYHLSTTLQELAARLSAEALDDIQRRLAGAATGEPACGDLRGRTSRTLLDPARIFENPVRRISRQIRDKYWDGLTRRIDRDHLIDLLDDEKVRADARDAVFVYTPHDDDRGYRYLSGLEADDAFQAALRQRGLPPLSVERLPADLTPAFVRDLGDRHGLLSLALRAPSAGDLAGVPFVVPGGRFNEMYGWDSYFEALGLLEDGRVDLAKGMVDNFVYQIRHYGKILNANRTYYLTRSQPPFLPAMARAVYERHRSRTWLAGVLEAAVAEYDNVWTSAPRLVDEIGLSRYFGRGLGVPPEVEPGHFAPTFARFAGGEDVATFEARYRQGDVSVPDLDRFFVHDRCMRESGHDTTYRWNAGGDRCADFVTVDLNSLLYRFETDIARAIETEFDGTLTFMDGSQQRSDAWRARARRRAALMNRYLWDAEAGLFLDYDTRDRRRHRYVAATAFYPLWAGLATPAQARSIVRRALPLLEQPGGLAASALESRGALSEDRPGRQWDYPNGWPPHQMLAWEALLAYGFDADAHRLAYRWLYCIASNAARYNGTVPEKFDVVTRSHQVFTEYGNVGTDFSYITREGFGWMNASYQVGLAMLPDHLVDALEQLVPPEWLADPGSGRASWREADSPR